MVFLGGAARNEQCGEGSNDEYLSQAGITVK